MARAFRNSNAEFTRAIASALGLDPDKHHITAIIVEAAVNEVPRAYVKMLVDIASDQEIAEVLKRYELIERSES